MLCHEGPCILLNYYQSTVPCCRPSFTDDKLNATSCLDKWQMHEKVLQDRRNQPVLVGLPTIQVYNYLFLVMSMN